jgi:hypothetical protein
MNTYNTNVYRINNYKLIACKLWTKVAVAGTISILLIPAAGATFLQGHLEENTIVKSATSLAHPKLPGLSKANDFKTLPDKIRPSPVVSLSSTPASPANSFPKLYEGCWQCMTTVTQSSLNSAKVGTMITCDVTFFRTADGRIQAHFIEPGWTEGKSFVISSNKIEAQTDRTDYYACTNPQETWAAHSQDHLRLVNQTSIVVDSCIEQIQNGRPIGNYRTSSILCKRTGQ